MVIKKVVKLKIYLHFLARTYKNREIEERFSIKCKQTFTNFSNYFRFLLNYCNQKIRQIEGISELLSYIVNNFSRFFSYFAIWVIWRIFFCNLLGYPVFYRKIERLREIEVKVAFKVKCVTSTDASALLQNRNPQIPLK